MFVLSISTSVDLSELPEFLIFDLILQSPSCCAKESLIPKEYPTVLNMITAQNSIAKKLPIYN